MTVSRRGGVAEAIKRDGGGGRAHPESWEEAAPACPSLRSQVRGSEGFIWGLKSRLRFSFASEAVKRWLVDLESERWRGNRVTVFMGTSHTKNNHKKMAKRLNFQLNLVCFDVSVSENRLPGEGTG